jgi:hypothetical protein
MKSCLTCGKSYCSKDWRCPSCGQHHVEKDGIILFAPNLCQEGGGFKAEYFARLFQLEAGNFWFRARNDIILWSLRSDLRNAKSFLEVGCGTGFVLSSIARDFPTIELIGSEIFLDGLSHASLRVQSAELIQMDARRIPYVDHFDGIGAYP